MKKIFKTIKEFVKKNKIKIKKMLKIIAVYTIFILGVVFMLKALNLTSVIQIQQAVSNTGIWGILGFILLNYIFMLAQVMPTAFVNIAGVYVFGLGWGILWSLVAVLSGAFFLFLLGRKFGLKIAQWVVGKENIDKWREKLTKGKYTILLLLLFPASPDSLIYVLSGMTNLKTRSYLIILLLSKPIGIVTTCLLGGGAIIPLTLAYVWVWGLVGLIGIIALYMSIKYQDKIDKVFNRLLKRD